MRTHLSFVLLALVGLVCGALSHRLGSEKQTSSGMGQVGEPRERFLPTIDDDQFSEFLQWLPTASVAALERRYGTLTDAEQFQPADLAMREILLQRWVTLDGSGAYKYAQRHFRGYQELVASSETVVHRWALADPVGLLETAVVERRIKFGVQRALRVLVENNPYDAIAHAERLELDVYSFRMIAAAWARLDPRAALTWTLGLADEQRRRYAIPSAFNEAPLEVAIELALKQRDPLMGAASEFLRKWGERDPEAAGSWLGSLEHDPQSIRALPFDYWRSSSGLRLAPVLVLTALEGLSKHVHEEGLRAGLSQVLAAVVGEMARSDPNAALGWLNRMPPNLLSDRVMTKLVSGWASQAPEDVLAFVESLPEVYNFGYTKGKLRSAARYHLAEAWSKSDPAGALAWLLTQPKEQRVHLADSALRSLADDDLGLADELMDSLGGAYTRAHGAFLSKWIKRSPERAADRLLEFDGDPEFAGSFEELGAHWVKEDPESCSAFLANLNPGPNRDGAVKGMVRSLLNSQVVDLEAAAAWTESMSKGELRADVTNGLIAYVTRADPENALAMLHRLDADSPAYRNLARHWQSRNPAQATAWLDTLEPGAKLDAALVGVIEEMSYDRHYGEWRSTPNLEVLPLIVRVSDREQRLEQLRSLAGRLPREEAVRLMALHQVRPDERDEILKQYESNLEEQP